MQESCQTAGSAQKPFNSFDWRAWLAAGVASTTQGRPDSDVHGASVAAGTSGIAAAYQTAFANGQR